MAIRGHEEGVPFGAFAFLHPVTQHHGLGARRRLVQQRGIGNVHGREVTDHRLEVQQTFEPPLRDLRLIRRVLRVPTRILQDVPLDHRRGHRPVVTNANVRPENLILRRDRSQVGQRLALGQGRGQIHGFRNPDRRRHRRLGQGGQGFKPQLFQHRLLVRFGRTNVTADETVRMGQTMVAPRMVGDVAHEEIKSAGGGRGDVRPGPRAGKRVLLPFALRTNSSLP